MIKKFFVLLIGFFLISFFLPAQGVLEDTQEVKISENILEPAHITYIEGMVKLNTENAEVNLPIISSDELKTEDGRVEVCLNGNYFRLDKNTHVVFIDFQEDSIMLAVKQGNIYIRAENKIIVQTPHKEFSLSTGLHLIEVTATIAKCLSNPPVKDDFDRFNEQCEQEFAPPETEQLPEELGEYESELSRNGEWREHERYGHVWIPHVSYGWRPYYYGRWNYVPILGWFWVSYEPFGWCTYHYGRWHWDPMWSSWYWIPVIGWGPAWVNWYGYGNYWGWCPMWYDNYYYNRWGRNYYGYSYGRGWSFVRKDQLQNRNIHSSILSRQEVVNNISQNISSNQLSRSTPTRISQKNQVAHITNNRFSPVRSNQQAQIQSRQPRQIRLQAQSREYPSRIRSASAPRSYSSLSRFYSAPRSYSTLRSYSRSSSPSFSRSSSPRSFSPYRSSSPSISRSSSPRSSGSPRRKN